MFKITKEKLGWLAGIIDGEGCIGLYNCGSHLGKYREIRAAIMIVNTNQSLVLEIKNILYLLGIKYSSSKRNPARPNWKPPYSIMIQNRDSIQKLLILMLPLMIGKREQAQILLQFSTRKKLTKYTSIEFKMVERMRILNLKGA